MSRQTSAVRTRLLSVLMVVSASSFDYVNAYAADAAPAESADATAELGEVTVTAQRRSERLSDVPISVKAIDANELANAGITSTADLPVLTPGLQFGYQDGTAQIFLRGVGTVALGPALENPVALYVDNVYYGATTTSIMSFNNIDKVEVDKGPQGTLFGRNATGGLIQVTTRTPSHVFGGTISGNYGDYATAGGDFYLTGGLTDYLAADFAVHFEHQAAGYGVNIVTGRDVGRTQDLALRNKWLFDISEATQLTLIFDEAITQFVPNYTIAPGTTPLGPPSIPLSTQDVAGIFEPFGNTHQGGGSAQLQHDLGFARFSSTTAYRRTIFDTQAAAQLTPDPEFSIKGLSHIKNSQFTQELQLQSPTGSRVDWTGGVYLYYDDAGFTPPISIGGGLIAPVTYVNIYDHQKSYSGAVYGQATTEIAPATRLTAGLRYTVERRAFRGYQQVGFDDGSEFSISDAQHKIYDKPTWRLSLDHHFAPDLMGYVSYNRGFKSGGFNDPQVPTIEFSPEVLDAFEGGVKTSFFNRRLSVDASGFFYNYKGVQALQYFENGNSAIYNAGGAHLYGADVDVRWLLAEHLSVTAAVEALHTVYTSFPSAVISTPVPGGGTAYSVGSAKGNRLPFAPDVTSSLTGEYTMPIAQHGDVVLSVTYLYNDGYFGEPDNRLRQPSYNVVNAQGSWNSPSKTYSVRFWGKNLTDADYTSSLASQPNGDFAVFFPPRTFGATVTVNF